MGPKIGDDPSKLPFPSSGTIKQDIWSKKNGHHLSWAYEEDNAILHLLKQNVKDKNINWEARVKIHQRSPFPKEAKRLLGRQLPHLWQKSSLEVKNEQTQAVKDLREGSRSTLQGTTENQSRTEPASPLWDSIGPFGEAPKGHLEGESRSGEDQGYQESHQEEVCQQEENPEDFSGLGPLT